MAGHRLLAEEDGPHAVPDARRREVRRAESETGPVQVGNFVPLRAQAGGCGREGAPPALRRVGQGNGAETREVRAARGPAQL